MNKLEFFTDEKEVKILTLQNPRNFGTLNSIELHTADNSTDDRNGSMLVLLLSVQW